MTGCKRNLLRWRVFASVRMETRIAVALLDLLISSHCLVLTNDRIVILLSQGKRADDALTDSSICRV